MTFPEIDLHSQEEQAFANTSNKQFISGIAWITHGNSTFSWIELWQANDKIFMCMHVQEQQTVKILPNATPISASSMLEELAGLYSRISYLHRYQRLEERDKLLQQK